MIKTCERCKCTDSTGCVVNWYLVRGRVQLLCEQCAYQELMAYGEIAMMPQKQVKGAIDE